MINKTLLYLSVILMAQSLNVELELNVDRVHT